MQTMGLRVFRYARISSNNHSFRFSSVSLWGAIQSLILKIRKISDLSSRPERSCCPVLADGTIGVTT
jgi:hypothetical protein